MAASCGLPLPSSGRSKGRFAPFGPPLIRAAYAPHALNGLRYWATHQSVEDTAKRLSRGVGFVGEVAGELVATITLSKPDPESKVPLLRDEYTWSFGQFAVAPGLKGKGYGRRIHDAALQHAVVEGCQVMALHTAEPANELIEMYRSGAMLRSAPVTGDHTRTS